MHSGGRRGWDKLRQVHWNVHITLRKTDSRNLQYNTVSTTQCCDNLGGGTGWEVGGRFKREGMYVCLWLIVDVWQKPTQNCKEIILQLKIYKWIFFKTEKIIKIFAFMSVESKHYWDQKSTQDEEHLILPWWGHRERDGKWDRAEVMMIKSAPLLCWKKLCYWLSSLRKTRWQLCRENTELLQRQKRMESFVLLLTSETFLVYKEL